MHSAGLLLRQAGKIGVAAFFILVREIQHRLSPYRRP
jgi:hypothetical protein